MITVRSLLVRVKPFRPDLTDEMAMLGLRDALARIATDTRIMKREDAVEVVSADTYTTDYADKDSVRTVRIDEVYGLSTYTIRTENGISVEMAYQGGWDASTDTPSLPAAGAGNNGQYYVVTVAGMYGGTTYIVGDVIFSDGTEWKKYTNGVTANSRDGFYRLNESNLKHREQSRNILQTTRNEYPRWAQENGVILWLDPPTEELLIYVKRSVDYSTMVDLDLDTVTLPPETERAMIAGALEFVYNLPGEGQSVIMADKYRREFHRLKSNLKGTSIFGYGGKPRYIVGWFAGSGGTR